MFSLTKLLQTSRFFLNPRLVNVIQSNSVKGMTLEEKLGLPSKPKKPLTPYHKFLSDTRPQVLRANPKLSMKEVIQDCAKKWNQIDDIMKKKMKDEYLKEKEQYLTELAMHDKKLTDKQKQEIEAAKKDAIENKEKRAYKKRLIENKKPKKPASGHVRFVTEAFKERDRGELPMVEFGKQLAKEWHALPEAKKSVYKNAYKADFALYKEDLIKWELKMIRLGNTDLVRKQALPVSMKKPLQRTAKIAK